MQRDNIVGTLHTEERINGGLSPRERLTGYGSVGGGVSSYNELSDLPTVNGIEFIGDMTSEDLGIWQPKDFSTSEQNTGVKWIDGKDIYRIIFSVDNPTYNTTIVNYDFSNLNIVDLHTILYRGDDAIFTGNFSPSNVNRAMIYAGTPYGGLYFEASLSYSYITRVIVYCYYTKN